ALFRPTLKFTLVTGFEHFKQRFVLPKIFVPQSRHLCSALGRMIEGTSFPLASQRFCCVSGVGIARADFGRATLAHNFSCTYSAQGQISLPRVGAISLSPEQRCDISRTLPEEVSR